MGALAGSAAKPGSRGPADAAGAGVSGQERTARAELSWLAAPGDRLLGALVRTAGAVEAMTLIRVGRFPRGAGLVVTPDARQAMSRWHAALGKVPPRGQVEQALGGRFRLVCPGDREWPGGLDGLGDAAPVALWVTGSADPGLVCARSVAVTGARAATAYGAYLAAEFGAGLGEKGRAVIAGGSFGVDAAAHRGALAAGGVTVAVTAGGIDVPYPAAHGQLFEAIAGCGALVSEAPPGTVAGRLRFAARCRVIAALAAATVIIEAGSRSGALTVASCARDLGRPVMAVPGPVTSALSAGCNELIRSGHAVLVTSPDDVAATLGAAGLAAADLQPVSNPGARRSRGCLASAQERLMNRGARADSGHGRREGTVTGKTRPTTAPGVKSMLTSRRRRRITENDQYAAFVRRVIHAWARRVAAGDIDAITSMTAAACDLDNAMRTGIAGLRGKGYSWAEIAARLGVTRQAAQQRWGSRSQG